MNKSELVSALAVSTKLTQKDAARFLDAFISIVGTTLQKGDDVTLVGFGSFKVAHRQARIGRNPKTGASLEIAASKIPQFKPGKALKDAIC